MGLKEIFKDIIQLGKNLIGDNPNQYVVSPNHLENEAILAMAEGTISKENAAELIQSNNGNKKFAESINDYQETSITLDGKDKEIVEKKAKKGLAKKKVVSEESEIQLPKDYAVKKAEEKVATRPAGELENQPREHGGKTREPRIK